VINTQPPSLNTFDNRANGSCLGAGVQLKNSLTNGFEKCNHLKLVSLFAHNCLALATHKSMENSLTRNNFVSVVRSVKSSRAAASQTLLLPHMSSAVNNSLAQSTQQRHGLLLFNTRLLRTCRCRVRWPVRHTAPLSQVLSAAL